MTSKKESLDMNSLKPYGQRILGLLIEQELRVAELYRIFADGFPDFREEWLSLHYEELEHAQWLEHLAPRVKIGDPLFNEDRARVFTIRASLDFINDAVLKARTARMTLQEALALTMSLEESLLERKIFDCFEGDSPELASTLARLRSETQDHAARIRAAKKLRRAA